MRRIVCGVAATLVLAVGTLFGAPVSAAAPAAAAVAPGEPACSLEEWQQYPLQTCIDRLQDVAASRMQCLQAPTPQTPDNGMAGWFLSKPTWEQQGIGRGLYSRYGYAGYDYTTYDIGCAQTIMHPDYKIENTVANGEFMLASGITGASTA
ncbi:MAG: MFS transporter, partial [Hamadaea sp.]|nr:MFS transporter [Hamadaea sp.]